MDIKNKLTEIVKITDLHLEKFWDEEINQNFGFNQNQKDLVKKLLDHAKDHNLRSAKRLRAAFVYYGYLLGNQKFNDEIFKAMIAVELVHTGLLMQDDVMDQDDLRRGRLTTHKYFGGNDLHYGESMANTLGDTLMSLGYEQILKTNLDKKLVNLATLKLLRGIIKTTFGQASDVALEKMNKCDETDVIALHKSKTAIYTYENPLLIGGILGGLDEKVLNILSRYSMEGGVAFQIQDDILGIFGDKDKTGKSNNSDLIHGKRTLLILKTLELGNEFQRNSILKVWGKNETNESLVKEAKKAIIDSGSFDYSKNLSIKYAKKAIKIAEELKQFKLNSEAMDFMLGIGEYLVQREM